MQRQKKLSETFLEYHGIQPLVSFKSLCKLMTLLHEVTGNPEGEFPRIRP